MLTTDGAGDVVWAAPAFSAVTTDATIDGDGNATALSLADDAVTTIKILDDNITPAKIEQGTNGQVLTTDGAGDVVWAAPAFSAVTTDTTIDGDGNATALSLADDAVTTIKVLDNNITPAKIEQGTNGQVLTTDGAGDVVWAAPAEATVSATAGSVFFADGTNGLAQDNTQLFWDNTNDRLGIGVNSGLVNKLTVGGSTRTSGLLNSNGTAGTPSYRFSNDTNLDTGMYFPAQDQLAFSAGGQEVLRIRESVGNGLEIIATGTLELTNQLVDETGAAGNVGDVLTATATGTEWKEPAVVAMGKANGANSISVNGATIGGVGGGINTVTLNNTRPDDDYIIQLSVAGDNRIYITSQNAGDFTVEIRSNATDALVVANWHFTILDF